MSAACTSEPISHLRLERYELHELPATERASVDAHLQRCPACSACLQALRASEVVLPPLPAPFELPMGRVPADLPEPLPRPRRVRVRGLAALGSGLALAAAALLGVRAWLEPPPRPSAGGSAGTAVKGGELALQLVRERGGDIARDPHAFSEGDRFVAAVTCAPPARVHAELVVVQAGETFFPLAPAGLQCGNLVQLPGAFELTGSAPADVCVVLADAPIDRTKLAGAPAEALPEPHRCVTVQPQR